MRRKYVWMALSIVAIWLAVVFLGLFGPTYEFTGAGKEYGLELETQSLATPVGYVAVMTSLFILLPIEKIMGKARIHTQKRYIWVALSIVAIWLAVLSVGLLGPTYEVAAVAETEAAEVAGAEEGEAVEGADVKETKTMVVAIPVTFFAAIATVVLAKFVADFGLGVALSQVRAASPDKSTLNHQDMF